jgi:adenylate cyclase
VSLPHDDLSESLRSLKSSEFIYEQALYPVLEYAFRHPLTQEVALHSQLQEHRKRMHASVAQAIERESAETLDEHAALLAHHWEEAGEPVRAASWHSVAAEWAGPNSPNEAERHWRSVRTLLDSVPSSAEMIPLATTARIEMLNFGWRQGMLAEEAERLLTEGLALTEESGDVAQRVRVMSTYAGVRYLTGAPAAVVGLCQENQVVAAQLQDAESNFAALAVLSNVYFMLGRLPEGDEVQDQLVILAEQDPDLGVDSFGVSGSWLGFGLRGFYNLFLGKFDSVEEWLRRCDEIAHDKDELEVLAWTASVRAWVATALGDGQRALSHARQAMELVERSGSSLARVIGFMVNGMALLEAREYRESVDALEEGLRIARETRAFLTFDGELGGLLARALAGAGEIDRALEVAREAVETCDRRQTRRSGIVARLCLSQVLRVAQGKDAADEVESVLNRVAIDVVETGARIYLPRVHEERGELALLKGNYSGFEIEFQIAHELEVEMGVEIHAARLAERLEAESEPESDA